MKKAFMSAMLLGFVLIFGIIVFVATTADDLVVQNKIIELKEITDNAAITMSKHYLIAGNTAAAEAISDGLLSETKLGNEVIGDIIYTWDFVSDPNNVKATIPLYNQKTFWYKFLDKESFAIENIESKANIVLESPLQDAGPLSPLAMNNCQEDDDGNLIPRDDDFFNPVYPIITLTFNTPYSYDVGDDTGLYALDPYCTYPSGDSQFAHFKGLFGQGEVEAVDFDLESLEGDPDPDDPSTNDPCLVQTSNMNPLTVDPMQLYNQLKAFDIGYSMGILMLSCDTTGPGGVYEPDTALAFDGVLSVELVDVILNKNVEVDGENTNELIVTFQVVSPDSTGELEY